jgi:outer membrane protein assembly factor BamB
VKASNPGLGELAPPDSLSPEVSGGGLSVLTAQGRRATLALLSALGDDGQPRWTTPLDRSLVRDACAAVVAGGGVVFALAARAPRPAELLCVDLRDGAVRWRTRT